MAKKRSADKPGTSKTGCTAVADATRKDCLRKPNGADSTRKNKKMDVGLSDRADSEADSCDSTNSAASEAFESNEEVKSATEKGGEVVTEKETENKEIVGTGVGSADAVPALFAPNTSPSDAILCLLTNKKENIGCHGMNSELVGAVKDSKSEITGIIRDNSQLSGVTRDDLQLAVGQMRQAMEQSMLTMKMAMEFSVQGMMNDLKSFLIAQVQTEIDKCKSQLMQEVDHFKSSMKEEFELFKIGFSASVEQSGDIYGRDKESGDRESDMAEVKSQLTAYIEEQEKKKKALNIRIMGLREEAEEKTTEVVTSFCRQELQIMDAGIVEAFRIGKLNGRDRHVIVKFRSREDKLNVLKKKTLLKGKKIWINDDLTKNQLQEYKEQMQIFREAKQNGKRAFWRRGKVVVDEGTA